jgi:DMSO reductase family type II enzyme heme b subunit
MMKKIFLALSLLLFSSFFFFVRTSRSAEQSINFKSAPTDPASIQEGKKIYDEKCQWCHGIKGDGNGPAANFVYPKPRDFTKGEYKFRTTQSGEIPTDWDIYRTITEGLHGTTMYGWGDVLTDQQRWDLVAYLKTFSDRFKNEQYTKDQVLTIPFQGDPRKADKALLEEGDKLYHDPNGAKCFMCHGNSGRGNGPSADTLTDDWNNKIWPADLTKGWDLRRGDSAEDIYCDISTGLEGSPMPSFKGALDADPQKDQQKRWALAYYVKSLQVPRHLGSLVKAIRLTGDLPQDPNDSKWNDIPYIDIPLAGQIIQNPREFTPSVDDVSVRACYNDKNVAFLLTWDDRTKNTATTGKTFPDAVQIQLPIQIPPDPSNSPKPYFLDGDKEHPVNLWYWDAQTNQAHQEIARGTSQISPENGASTLSAKSVYDDGMWKVEFIRPLTTNNSNDLQFEVGKFIPIAFSVWDGGNGEHGNQRSISSWFYCLLIPPVKASVYIIPVIALIFGILLEFWAAKKAKEYLQ